MIPKLLVEQVFSPPPSGSFSFMAKFCYLNSLTDISGGGMLGIIFLIVIGFSLFLMMKSFKSESAMGVSIMITSVIGMIMRLFSTCTIVNDYVMYILIGLFVVSIFVLRKESSLYEN
jgi:hypothetical protein